MITGVAIKHIETGMVISMPKPNRHGDIFNNLYDWYKANPAGDDNSPEWTQGFVTENGTFLNRQDAAQYVKNTGQELTPEAKEEYAYKRKENFTTLYSEDLW